MFLFALTASWQESAQRMVNTCSQVRAVRIIFMVILDKDGELSWDVIAKPVMNISDNHWSMRDVFLVFLFFSSLSSLTPWLFCSISFHLVYKIKINTRKKQPWKTGKTERRSCEQKWNFSRSAYLMKISMIINSISWILWKNLTKKSVPEAVTAGEHFKATQLIGCDALLKNSYDLRNSTNK